MCHKTKPNQLWLVSPSTITFLFHCFFSSLARSKYLPMFLFSFIFTIWYAETISTRWQFLFFFFVNTKSGLLTWIGRSVYILKSLSIKCVSFARTVSGLCNDHLLVWWNITFLPWITFLTVSIHVLVLLFCYYLLIRVFHISFSWWSFTRVWVTASFLKFPGLFSAFWPFSIML